MPTQSVTCWRAIAIAFALCSTPAFARSQDVSCQTVVRLESGGFTYRPQPGLSVLRLARAEGDFAFANGGDVVGFTCLRTEILPEADADLEVLRAGFTLSISDGGVDLRVLDLKIENGRILTRMLAGTLSEREQRQLDQIASVMQVRLEASAR